MKKIILIISMIFIFSIFANANDLIVELQGQYFYPSDKVFQDIYGSGIMYGAEASLGVWRSLDVWFGGSYISKQGELTFTKEETELEITRIGGGIKYRLLQGSVTPYIGFGLCYFQYKERNIIGDKSEDELGYIGKLGSYVIITDGFIVDFYVNYSYCKLTPADFSINTGGIEAGIGLGYKF